jgi:hypothetical protein
MTTRIACTGISGRILQGRVTADGKSFSGQTKDVFRKGDHAFTCFKEIPKNSLQ